MDILAVAEIDLNKCWTFAIGAIVIMLAVLSGPVSAKGPDFSTLTEHSFELSGVKLRFQLPGRLDKEFPSDPGENRVNIYDTKARESLLLLERHWDYRSYIWRKQYALHSLIVSLENLPDDINVNLLKDIHGLQDVIEKNTKERYRKRNKKISDDPNQAQIHHEVTLVFEQKKIADVDVLKCIKTDNQSRSITTTLYFIPVSEAHYVGFTFKTTPLEAGRKNPDKWVSQRNNDILKTMNTLTINY